MDVNLFRVFRFFNVVNNVVNRPAVVDPVNPMVVDRDLPFRFRQICPLRLFRDLIVRSRRPRRLNAIGSGLVLWLQVVRRERRVRFSVGVVRYKVDLVVRVDIGREATGFVFLPVVFEAIGALLWVRGLFFLLRVVDNLVVGSPVRPFRRFFVTIFVDGREDYRDRRGRCGRVNCVLRLVCLL